MIGKMSLSPAYSTRRQGVEGTAIAWVTLGSQLVPLRGTALFLLLSGTHSGDPLIPSKQLQPLSLL